MLLRTRTIRRRRGLTLMELVIVLTVLAALAAIAIPMFPNLLRRAHKATDATQTSEVAKAVQMYQALYLSYPNNFDLLTDGSTFPNYIPADGGNAFGGFCTLRALNDGSSPGSFSEQKALARVGITTVQKFITSSGSTFPASPFHPTINPYAGPMSGTGTATETIVGSTLMFATLNKAAILAANPNFLRADFESDPTAEYLVFGVGGRCSMISKVLQDAPTSVPQNKEFTPATLYSRVGVIFKINGAEVQRTERARFIAAVALEDDELELTEKDIAGYYDVARE